MEIKIKVKKDFGVDYIYVRYITLSKYGIRNFNSMSAILSTRYAVSKVLNGYYPDIIHAHTIMLDGRVGVWIKEHFGVPLVITTHGSDLIKNIIKNKTTIENICNQADAIVTVSKMLSQKIDTCNIHTPVFTIYNGINMECIDTEQRRIKHSIIQVGSLIPRKNVDITIKAFSKVKQRFPDAKLVVCGTGKELENLIELCNQLNINDCVKFKGQISNKDVFREMSKSEIFVMPSKNEGFGIVYLEAMSCGCVTIGTKGEGICEVIKSGVNGILINPDDVESLSKNIEEVFLNENYRNILSKNGVQCAREFTWEKNVTQYIGLFKKIRNED